MVVTIRNKPAQCDPGREAASSRSAKVDPSMAAFDAIAPIDRDALRPGNRFAGPAIVERMDATTLRFKIW